MTALCTVSLFCKYRRPCIDTYAAGATTTQDKSSTSTTIASAVIYQVPGTAVLHQYSNSSTINSVELSADAVAVMPLDVLEQLAKLKLQWHRPLGKKERKKITHKITQERAVKPKTSNDSSECSSSEATNSRLFRHESLTLSDLTLTLCRQKHVNSGLT